MDTGSDIALISVDEALARGQKMLLWPRILLCICLFFFLFPLALLFIALKDGPKFSTNVWLVFGGVILFTFVFFFFLPFLFWSKQTTRWKLWAFSRVNDIQELKKAARRAALCAGYGTFMDKLQIQSATEREQWRRLQQRTDAPDTFIDDTGTAQETVIYYSTVILLLNIVLPAIMMPVGIWLSTHAFTPGTSRILFLIGAVLTLMPVYLIVKTLINLIRHRPQIILNDKGLFTISTGFLPWDQVFGERVEIVDQGRRGVKYTLHFQYPGGMANIEVTNYAKRSKLEGLMRIYRGRFKASAY